MSHDAGVTCVCVADHRPNVDEHEKHHIWPLGRGGPDTPENLVWLCPTTHMNVHTLERAWWKAKGSPSWDVRKRFNYYTRELARRAYESAIYQVLVP